MLDGPIPEGLTFDDVLLLPARSSVLPTEVDTQTKLTRNITLNLPIVSAAMDTVTESRLAIALAQQGGMGIVHRSMPIDYQAAEVDKVKRSESGMIVDPVTVSPESKIYEAQDIMKKYKISGVPVTRNGKLMGILTNRDLRFETRFDLPVEQVMTKENLITVSVGTTLDEAEAILHKHRVEKLLVVDEKFNLKGLITVKDIQKRSKYPNACKDSQGRLRVGAALGATGDFLERAAELVKAQVDVLVVDTAHGHSSRVMEAVRQIKHKFPDVDLIAGNVATFQGAGDLIQLGVDGVKVGVGPGSICTTRVVTGAGVPQITAIAECARAARNSGIPVIADGGIKYSGDVSKAIAAGASCVMIGSLFAGTEESPGESILYQGRSF
ncbi:MAG: IMP dehydrogenase, partial [Terriglobia bacterium]